MRSAKMVLAAMTGLLLLCASWGDACGDKLLVVGRGVKYSRAGGAMHTASILIYKNASAPGGAVTGDAKFEESLKRAGHKVRSVGDAPGLDAALKSARYDLVLVDPADSPSLEKEIAAQPSKPTVVPVLYEPSASSLAAAEKEYGCALKAPSKDYLSAIDDIMARRIKAAGAKTARTQ
jgi:ABC-type amino acid transport substrate-binding protein